MESLHFFFFLPHPVRPILIGDGRAGILAKSPVVDNAISEAQRDESEFRSRHFSAGAATLENDPSRNRALRQPHLSDSDPSSQPVFTAGSRQPTGPPVAMSSSPESRGQRVNKSTLNYLFIFYSKCCYFSEILF